MGKQTVNVNVLFHFHVFKKKPKITRVVVADICQCHSKRHVSVIYFNRLAATLVSFH